MESIDTKIKTVSDEINCICDEHEISEELVLKCAELIKKRQDLEYQTKNEVWEKKKSKDVYLNVDSLLDLILPDFVSVAICPRQNLNNFLFQEIGIDINDIYDYSYVNDVDKEYEEMCQKYNPQDPEFIVWCLKREFPDKEIEYHQYNGCADAYDCFFVYDKKDYDNINDIVAIVKNYCQSKFDQYERNPDNVLDYTDLITIFESYLPSNNLQNEDEIKDYLKRVSETDRNIVIKY